MTASCQFQALGDGHGYQSIYTAWFLTENGWITREIGGVMSIANGTTYDGRSTDMSDEHYCDGYRETNAGPPISPC